MCTSYDQIYVSWICLYSATLATVVTPFCMFLHEYRVVAIITSELENFQRERLCCGCTKYHAYK